MPTLEYLFEQADISIEDVAERSNLSVDRVEAIIVGRWTPSPQERQRIAGVFEASVDEIAWGHSIDPRNIRYRRTGIEK